MDTKSQLYSYYLDLLNEISSYSSEKIKKYPNLNYKNLSISELVQNIKDSTSELIHLKISEIISQNINSNSYLQLENYTKKLENDIKSFYHKFFEYKIQINALEDKVNMYKIIQIEYEELKEKVKFHRGKFLDNERKDNEILILRQENNILKKEITKLDKINTLNENLKKNYMNKINNLQNEIEQLTKRLELKYNSNNSISNYNSSSASNINININNNENILSKLIYKHDSENINNIMPNNSSRKNKYNYLKGLKNLFPKNSFYTNKRPSNYNIIKNLYMNSNNNYKNNNNNNFNSSTVSTINTNIFTSNYNKLISNISQKKKKCIKKKLKHNKKINSCSMKNEKEEDKSLSMNKYLRNNNNDSRFMYKSDSKNKKSYSKIINFNSNESCPLSCQHKDTSKIGKSLSKKMRYNKNRKEYKMKKSNSALNIKVNSK
jgi:hypothetical protein